MFRYGVIRVLKFNFLLPVILLFSKIELFYITDSDFKIFSHILVEQP